MRGSAPASDGCSAVKLKTKILYCTTYILNISRQMKSNVYIVTDGTHKGELVVKTTYVMPKTVFVRGLKPLPFGKMVKYCQNTKVCSSVRTVYPEFNVLKRFLKAVGTITINKCFKDPNGISGVCGPSGFDLLEAYAGKTKAQVSRMGFVFKQPVDYTKRVK